MLFFGGRGLLRWPLQAKKIAFDLNRKRRQAAVFYPSVDPTRREIESQLATMETEQKACRWRPTDHWCLNSQGQTMVVFRQTMVVFRQTMFRQTMVVM